MVFIDRRDGVSLYGMNEDHGLGFKQLRKLRQFRELTQAVVSLKKYELGFYLVVLVSLLFAIMSVAQIVFFATALASLFWIIASLVINSQKNSYYLKKDIKIKSRYSAPKRKRDQQAQELEESFGDDAVSQVYAAQTKPQVVFKAMQSLLLRLMVVARRKRVMPFVSKVEVKGRILKTVSEDGQNRFYSQHFLKYGRNHFAVVECEKFSGQIHHIFEIKFIPRSRNVVLSVFLRGTDSSAAFASVDALAREMIVGCEEEDVLREALSISYFKACEFVGRPSTKAEELAFEQVLPSLDPPEPQEAEAADEDEFQPKVSRNSDCSKEVLDPFTRCPDRKSMDQLVTEFKLVESNLATSEIAPTDSPDKKDTKQEEAAPVPSEQQPSQPHAEQTAPQTLEATAEQSAPPQQSAPAESSRGFRVVLGLECKPEIPESAIRCFEEKHKWLAEYRKPNNGKWKESENKNGLVIYEQSTGALV